MSGTSSSFERKLNEFWRMFMNLGHLAIIGVLIWPLLLGGIDLDPWMKIAIVSIVLATVSRSACVPLLVLFQISLFFHEPRSYGVLDSFSAIAFACMAIAILMYASHYRIRHARVFSGMTDALFPRVVSPRAFGRHDSVEPAASAAIEAPALFSVIPRNVSRAIIFALAAQLVLAVTLYAQIDRAKTNRWRGAIEGDWPSAYLLVAILGIVIILGEVFWTSLTPKQAWLYVRSCQGNLLYRDLRRIALRRLARCVRTAPEPADALAKIADDPDVEVSYK